MDAVPPYERIEKIKQSDLDEMIEKEKAWITEDGKKRSEKEQKEYMESSNKFIQGTLDKITVDHIMVYIAKGVAANRNPIMLYRHICKYSYEQRDMINPYDMHIHDILTKPLDELLKNRKELVIPVNMDTSKSIIQLIDSIIPEGYRLYHRYTEGHIRYEIYVCYDSMICHDPCCILLTCGSFGWYYPLRVLFCCMTFGLSTCVCNTTGHRIIGAHHDSIGCI